MREEWDQLSAGMAAVWPAGKMTPEVQATWWVLLEDLEGGHVAMALNDLAKTSEFMPTVAEIRMAAAAHEARTAPKQLADWQRHDGERITFAEWRRRGYPGLEDHGITRERVEEMIREGLLPGIPTDA